VSAEPEPEPELPRPGQAPPRPAPVPGGQPASDALASDLGHSALAAARRYARGRGDAGANGRGPAARRVAGSRRGGYSGARADDRDPQPLGELMRRLVFDRGWQSTVTSAAVAARWDCVVGAEIAARCRPESLRDGELVLVAESTAWATQLRLLVPRLMSRITAELGPGVVNRIRVHGPTAPTWRRGPLRVTGRGPRDTYG
jgi:predicted nucleic acid-binding Zn ribbon protein